MSPQEFAQNVHRLTPVYPVTKGLSIAAITKTMHMALDCLNWGQDYLPVSVRQQYGLFDFKAAVTGIHFPEDYKIFTAARKRLVFEEFLFFIVSVMFLKDLNAQEINDAPMVCVDACQDLINRLPYELTGAQKQVWKQIEQDMCSTHIMNRLVQGDVGSGKTIVAVLANTFVCDESSPGSVYGTNRSACQTALCVYYGIGAKLSVAVKTSTSDRCPDSKREAKS